ncbi:MAG TPA: GntR family transcriptional regulator [Xanthobacteraceae bacterium]|nr:GntR family transcriptional regulator [Xanthobacteraceae bacterium]
MKPRQTSTCLSTKSIHLYAAHRRVPACDFAVAQIFENPYSIENNRVHSGAVMRIAAHAPQAEPTISAGMEVLTRLRESILTGHYGPGEKLRFADLQNDFAAGIGTLREALSQLVGEGLVTVDAGRGFRVAPVSRDDLLDITALHVDFERRAARDSVANGDDEWEARVLTAFHRLSKIENLSKAERLARHAEWVQRHREFHEALVSACRSRWLLNFRAILFDQSERYRLLSKRYRPEGSPKLREHVIIKDAALARDAARTADLLARHIEETAENVLKVAPQFTAAGALAANAREAARPGRKTRRNPASQRVRGKA